MASYSNLLYITVRRILSFVFYPLLRYYGYRQSDLSLGLPKSHYFFGEDSLGSLNQINKRYLKSVGWIESKNANQSIRDGKYIPWTSYAFTHWIAARNLKNSKMLEFGTGASTIYWGANFGEVVGIESDPQWLNEVKKACLDLANVKIFSLAISADSVNHAENLNHILPNLEDTFRDDLLLFPELEISYCSLNIEFLVSEIRSSDYIFVDGGPRNTYMSLVAKFANKKSVVIIDNSDQYYTVIGRNFLVEAGFKEIEFNSLGPLNPSATSTSVFIKDFVSL